MNRSRGNADPNSLIVSFGRIDRGRRDSGPNWITTAACSTIITPTEATTRASNDAVRIGRYTAA